MLTRDGEQSPGPWPSIQRGDYVSVKGGPGAFDSGDGEPDPRRIAFQPDFGRGLTLVRQRAGLTVREVARAVGIPASTTGDYFAGRHLPPPSQPGLLPRILRTCGVTDQAQLSDWMSALNRI